jgi:hypothetical protein
MPFAGPPPRNCPICREQTWSREVPITVGRARTLYRVHLQTKHPEYESWHRKISRNYLIALVLCLVPASVLATQVRPVDLARFLSLLAIAPAFAVIAIISVILERGKRRFRELWNEEHGAPVTPH